MLGDIIENLENYQIKKLVILNGHGGNNFRQMIRELQKETVIFLCTIDWFKINGTLEIFDEPGDHAGEMETSIVMHLEPELVLPLTEAGDGKAKKFKIKAFGEGWAWAPRHWTKVTKDTGVGNPQFATPEKGEKYFRKVTETIAGFLTELAKTKIENIYK